MTAIFKRELRSYFSTVTGYVFGAFLLLFIGIYTLVYNLQYNYTNFEYVLGNMSFVFIVIVPILTMRVLAEERRQKTDQLLYALPLTMTQVVLGKYAAMLVMFLIPMGLVCLYPVILSGFGNIYFPAAYSAIIAFILLGAALLSIGMFISSVTESQAVAAGICFVVMLLNFFIADLASFVPDTAFGSFAVFAVLALLFALVVRMMTKNTVAALSTAVVLEVVLLVLYIANSGMFEGLFPEIMAKISLFEHFYSFIDGVFDLTSVVYFVTVAGIFLFLSIQSMEKRRWSE